MRRQGGNVADGYRLVGVIEVGGGGGRAQAAGAARVGGGHVVQTVADGELVSLVEVMVDLGEQIAVVDRIGIDAGGNLRTGVSDGGKPRVDDGHVSGRNGSEAGLVQFPLLEVREVKGAVVNDRAAEAHSVLRLGDGESNLGQGVGGIEALVLKVAI